MPESSGRNELCRKYVGWLMEVCLVTCRTGMPVTRSRDADISEGQIAPLLESMPKVKIAPLDERFHLSVGDRALQHPESAIGVNPTHPAGAQLTFCCLDTLGHFVRSF